MTKRICWKKGMRLTDEVLRMSDNCFSELVEKAFVLAAAGRFGLLPSVRPFQVAFSINKNLIDVDLLDCLAITRGGSLIDVSYDTKFSNAFDTRVVIPSSGEKEYLLTVCREREEWRETNDGYCEPVYSFKLHAGNVPLPDNAFPIAHIVDEYGWRMDDIDFVPPCLFLSSHRGYEELHSRFLTLLHAIDTNLSNSVHSDCHTAICVLWPIVQQLIISCDKEKDLMTPMILFGNVQKCVNAFLCACTLEKHLELGEPESFQDYVRLPYNYKDVYVKIREGLDLCAVISAKVEKFNEVEVPVPEPPQPQQEPQVKRKPGWMGLEI